MYRIILTSIIIFSINPLSANNSILNSYKIEINPSIQIRQRLNQCGPASAMAVINAYTGMIIPLEKINSEMGSRLGNNMTYPWGITDYLKTYNIKSSLKFLTFRSDESRLTYLKRNISENKQIIMLNDLNDILHYFTILGYNSENEFYIYDSMQPVDPASNNRITIDTNGMAPGNLTLDKETLFIRLEKAKYKFINYVVIVPTDGIE